MHTWRYLTTDNADSALKKHAADAKAFHWNPGWDMLWQGGVHHFCTPGRNNKRAISWQQNIPPRTITKNGP